MTPALPICADCRHYAEGGRMTNSRCSHPALTELDLVTGVVRAADPYKQRSPDGLCGEFGVHYERRPK